jgi:AcrR family transcriptional regulator
MAPVVSQSAPVTEAGDAKVLRSDARRNRERILAAARTLLARDGADASVEEITRLAGVGMGTLYRHFETKAELIDAVLEDAFDEIVGAAERCAADPDPWRGFAGFLDEALAMHADNRGLKDAVVTRAHGRQRAEAMRARLRPLVAQMVARAQAAGALRPDFTVQDVPLIFWTGSRVIEATAAVAPDCWRRYLGLLLDGLRADAATPLPAPPLTTAALEHASGHGER